MNTYLPYPSFNKSAGVLDNKRLNRQRSDVLSILKACKEPPPEDSKEHPAIHMWRGSELVLIEYGVAICLEWKIRGNSDTLLPKILEFQSDFSEESATKPEWLGDNPFHQSHKSYLLRLLPSWYSNKFTDVRDDLPMIWPRYEQKVSAERLERERERALKRAQKAKIRAEKAVQDARTAAIEAGLHPDTLEPISTDELEQYRNDEDQLELLPKELVDAEA